MRASERDSYQYVEGAVKTSGSNQDKLLRFFQSGLLMDVLSCALLTAGLGSAALTLTGLGSGFWGCFGFACVSTLLLAAFSLQWWLAPAFAAAAVSASALYLGLTGRLGVSGLAGFFEWAWSGAPYDEAYSGSGGAVALKASVIFIIALVCFILIRKLFSLPAIFLLSGAGLGTAYYLGHADLSVPLCVCAAGMAVLLPRVYARYVSLRSPGGERRGGMQAVAVPAAVLAMLFALWLIPEDTSAWRSRGLNNFISDIAYMFEGPFNSYPSSASGFSMKKLGFEGENGRLGGPVRLTDEIFLSVTADRAMLLRGAVMDYYTGEGWQTGAADGDFRFGSLFWRGYRNSAFGMNKPLGGEARRQFEALTFEQELAVSYHDDGFNTIFAGGMPRDAGFEKNSITEPVYFNMRSELYLHYRIPQMAKLLVKTRVWNTDMPGFDEGFLRLEELAANRGNRDFPEIQERYTRLPDTMPESVGGLAREIIAGSMTPYQKAKAIERWLSENCEYTLEPAVPPENTDFVEYFISTRKGYCTYYASAMAVLARSAGLPSRYVTGFALERDSGKASLFFATGETAHAWVEIYFDGIGWIEFDPLGWNPAAPLNQAQGDLSDIQQEPGYTPPQSRADDLAPGESAEQDAQKRGGAGMRQVLSLAAAAVLLYLSACLAVYRVMRRKFRVYELSRVSRKIPDLNNRIDFYFDDIIKQLSVLGVIAQAGETLTDFSARVDRRLKLKDKSFSAVAGTQMRLHFAEAAPSEGDCEAAFSYHYELESILRERLGKTMYFFKRAVRR